MSERGINLNEQADSNGLKVLEVVHPRPGHYLASSFLDERSASALIPASDRFLVAAQSEVADGWVPYDAHHRPYAQAVIMESELVTDEEWDYRSAA